MTPTDCNTELIIPIALKEMLTKYQMFIQSTLGGKRGKTAKFFLQYVDFMNIYFRFSRSIRTSNFNLYIETLSEMADLFFIFNQQNYARWILMYQRNLIDMRNNNNPLFQHFLRGAFGIKRTNKNIARAPVDLTLEQTINADAANTLTGISHFTNSISARQRWALSHSIRTKIITKLLESINYIEPDDITHELEVNRIAKDRKAFNDFSNAVEKSMNPFSLTIDPDNLFNIVTGKAVSDETSEFILSVREKGKEQKRKFIEECAIDEIRFERAIKKNKILNFASESLKKSQNTSDGKRTTIRMERDIFGRLLGISLRKKVDMETCLKYPLSPFPPALTYSTGEMFKTDKSALAKKIISSIETSVPRHLDVEIIDGFHLLHNLGPSIPQAFGKIAEFILKKICNTTASEIHLIFDRYLSPSIKDIERSTRKEDEIPFAITGPLQSRPTDFNKNLNNPKFKEAIVTFLYEHWTDNTFGSIFNDKKVFLTVRDQCFVYSHNNGIVTRILNENYTCYHEEADTRIFFHLNKCLPLQKVLIKSVDTDVLIICLGNIHKFEELEIWITTKTNNDINYINCTHLAQKLGSSVCRALPGFHAFTGCDYTAAFVRKGKIKAYNLLIQNEEYQNIFENLTDPEDINNKQKTDIIQRFTNDMYNIANSDVDAGRFELFLKFFASTSDKEEFYKGMINFNSSNIPPCWKTLSQKILRTIFVNKMWQNATEPICILHEPTTCGWQLNEFSKLEPLWYVGPSAPLKVEEILSNQQNEEESEESGEERNYNLDDNDLDDY